MAKVKLFNQGERIIIVKDAEGRTVSIGPKQFAELEKADADRLKAMYEGELVDEKERMAVFKDADTKADAKADDAKK